MVKDRVVKGEISLGRVHGRKGGREQKMEL